MPVLSCFCTAWGGVLIYVALIWMLWLGYFVESPLLQRVLVGDG